MKEIRISYEDLREWMHKQKITQQEMAKAVGKSSLSPYMSKGRPMPIEWLLTWQEIYHWTDVQLCLFGLGKSCQMGPQEKDDGKIKVAIMDVKDLQKIFAEA